MYLCCCIWGYAEYIESLISHERRNRILRRDICRERASERTSKRTNKWVSERASEWGKVREWEIHARYTMGIFIECLILIGVGHTAFRSLCMCIIISIYCLVCGCCCCRCYYWCCCKCLGWKGGKRMYWWFTENVMSTYTQAHCFVYD